MSIQSHTPAAPQRGSNTVSLFPTAERNPARSRLFAPIAAPLKRATPELRVHARQAAEAYARMFNQGSLRDFLPLLDPNCEFVTRDQTWTGFGAVADVLRRRLLQRQQARLTQGPRQQAVGTVHVGAGRAAACSFQLQVQEGASYRVTTFRIRDGRVVAIFEQASDPSWYRVQGSHLYPRRAATSRRTSKQPALPRLQMDLGFGNQAVIS